MTAKSLKLENSKALSRIRGSVDPFSGVERRVHFAARNSFRTAASFGVRLRQATADHVEVRPVRAGVVDVRNQNPLDQRGPHKALVGGEKKSAP